jgi:serralysin
VSIDPNNLAATAHATFDDEFNNLSLWNGASGTWATSFWYQDPNGNGASLTGNGEQEWYINSQYGPTSGVHPWTANNGVATITATPTPSWLSGQVNNYSYVSGELNTFHSFSQTYGYFEMRAQLPKGQGFWPAFWLMPENGNWPPELDVMEVLGQNTSMLMTTVHSNAGGNYSKSGVATQVADTSAGYHTYGVDWEPDYITWYFDGQQVFRTTTPSDLNSPMYIIANLAVGGYWPGPADGVSSAGLNIDYIRAYAAGAGSTPTPTPTPSPTPTPTPTPAPTPTPTPSGTSVQVSDANYWAGSGVTSITLTGWAQNVHANDAGDAIVSNNAANHLYGGAGNDSFVLGRGGDIATGGGGTDTYTFKEVPWTPGHITDFTGSDVLELSAMFNKYGYWGSNPIGDGRLKLIADGQGGTQVWAVLDGLSGASGTWLVTTLDHILPANVAWQNGHLVDPPAGGGASTGGGSSASGQTFTSDNAGDHWTGTAGADIFNVGRGGDVIAGGGGADVYKFAEVPWAGGHITDFGADDSLDFSAMLAHYGYSGSNAFNDGRITFADDGQGGAQVWLHMNGLPAGWGDWLVTTVDHVAPSSLHMSGGVISEGASAGAGAGQVFTSDNAGDHWTGTSGADTFNLGRGGDVVAGGAGNDTFKFAEIPWAKGHITDFTPGQDALDLSAMYARYGYAGANPVGEGRLVLSSDSQGGTNVWFVADGLTNTTGTWLVTDLDHVSPSSLHVNGGWITG